MRIFTNNDRDVFGSELEKQLASASSVFIAVGYISERVLERNERHLLNMVRGGGQFTIILGMAFYEGARKALYDKLMSLNDKAKSINDKLDPIKVVWNPKPYHGKVYKLETSSGTKYYCGSSNFTDKGLYNYVECDVELTDTKAIPGIERLLSYLNRAETSINIANVENFPICEVAQEKIQKHTPALSKSDFEIRSLPYFDITFDRSIGSSCANAVTINARRSESKF